VGFVLLGGAIVLSALAFGAQTPWPLALSATAAAGAAVLLKPRATPRPCLLLLALATYTLLQLLPLPVPVVRVLSPRALAVWSGAFRLLERPIPAWLPLSVDPAGTALEVVKWFGYSCVLSAACGFRERRGMRALALLIFGTALVVCVTTLAHGVADAKRIYGIYTAPTPSRWLRGPFVNGNNLAGYLNLGLFTGAGLWASPKTSLPNWCFALGLPVLATGVLLSESRGGIVGLAVGAIAFAGLLAWRKRVAPARLGFGVLLLVVGGCLAFILDGSGLLQTLLDRQWQAKLGVWRWSLDLIRDFPGVGVGRGAFETAFQPYRRLLVQNWTAVYAYAENLPLQWAADWGIPVAGAALAVGIWCAWRALPSARREPLTSGLYSGLIALFSQNLLDLGLEIFAVMAAACVAMAGLRARDEPAVQHGTSRVALSGAAGALLGCGIVFAYGARPVQLDRRRLADEYAAWSRTRAPHAQPLRADLERAVLRHPGDAYLGLVGSFVHEREAMRWVGHALERSPFDGRVHLRLSELLIPRGARDQALLHLRLSALYDAVLRDGALTRAAALLASAADLRRAFPAGAPGAALLGEVCPKLGPALAVACWRELVAREPSEPVPKRQLAGALLSALSNSSADCGNEGRQRCVDEVEGVLATLEKGARDFRIIELRARSLALRGETAAAARMLVEGCPATNEAWSCCELAFEFARRAKDFVAIGVAAARYAALACSEPERCARVHQQIGRAYGDLGAWSLATSHFFEAADRAPNSEHWLDAADAAARSGADARARVALTRAQSEGNYTLEQQRRAIGIESSLSGLSKGPESDLP